MEQTSLTRYKIKKILNNLAYILGEWLKTNKNNSILFQLINNFINGFQQKPVLYPL
jgi:hypothetical protein